MLTLVYLIFLLLSFYAVILGIIQAIQSAISKERLSLLYALIMCFIGGLVGGVVVSLWLSN